MLHITNMTYRLGTRPLFEGATLHVPPGRKLGLVGRNGAGKSTLIRLILGQISPESGDVSVRPGARIGHVAQEAPSDERSLLQVVLDSDLERKRLLEEAETTTDPTRISDVHTRLADINSHTAEARAATILKGLGFDDRAQARPASSFSGGWRMRVSLASTLFLQPDLLLLDEPTNYLDLEGVIWLETYLSKYPYTVILISHDRDLLNKAVTHIAHLDECRLAAYTGGYDRFERMRVEAQERQMSLKTRQESERRRLQGFVDRFKAKASKARQAQSRVKALEKMKPVATIVTEETIPFQFPKPDALSSPLISLDDASTGYGDNVILKNLTLRVDMDDRIALLGANGNGKSTFAKLICNRISLFDGTYRKPKKLSIGYFAQHQLDELSPLKTPYESLREKLGIDMTEAKVRARLGGFGFGAEKADRAINTLSGGEKARLLFAFATLNAPHLLILDEPTNHLDIDSREALVHALNDYEGAVLLISHDRHLVEACVDRLWLVKDQSVLPFEGDLTDYKKILLETERSPHKKNNKTGSGKKEERASAASARADIQPLKQAILKMEDRLDKAQSALDIIEKALGAPHLYKPGSEAKLQDLIQKSAGLKALLATTEEQWIRAQDKLDKASR